MLTQNSFDITESSASKANSVSLAEIELFRDNLLFDKIPTHLFIVVSIVCSFSFFYSFFVGFVFTLFSQSLLFYLHRNDPQAISVYLKSVSLPYQINHFDYQEINVRRS